MKRAHNREIKGKDPKVFGKKSSESQMRDVGSRLERMLAFSGGSLDFGLQAVGGQTEEHGPRSQAT